MAKSSKSKTKNSKTDTSVTDAVDVADAQADDALEAENLQQDDAPDDVPDDENGIELASNDQSADQGDMDMEIIEDPIEMPSVDPEPTPVPAQPAPEGGSSGFAPLLIGGVLAGAIGYGVATFFPLFGDAGSGDLSAQVAAQSEQIAALEDRISNLPAPDLSAVEDSVAALGDDAMSQISDVADSLSAQLATLDERLTELEKQPNADGTLSDSALAAYERELEQLRADLEAQQQTVMSAAAQAEADLATARAEAEALEQEALAAAEAAAARAALNRIATAVETGAPFGDALADLGAADAPAALIVAADVGVATTAQLTADFPAVARAALATARAEGVSDDAGGLGGFFRSQFDVRSTAPKEGPGPDAVLSRAEAAVKEGRIADALAEIDALPEVARAEMTDWTARATERADVLDAIATLSETYN